ncbi:hypothetical protein VTK26DRAFT_5406 [Humicola hyalothermophila]
MPMAGPTGLVRYDMIFACFELFILSTNSFSYIRYLSCPRPRISVSVLDVEEYSWLIDENLLLTRQQSAVRGQTSWSDGEGGLFRPLQPVTSQLPQGELHSKDPKDLPRDSSCRRPGGCFDARRRSLHRSARLSMPENQKGEGYASSLCTARRPSRLLRSQTSSNHDRLTT